MASASDLSIVLACALGVLCMMQNRNRDKEQGVGKAKQND